MQIDFIKEIFNTGLGEAGVELSELVEDEVELSVPDFQLLSREVIYQRLGIDKDTLVNSVAVTIGGDISGNGILVFPEANSLGLIRTIVEEAAGPDAMTDQEEEALVEISGIILNNLISTISEFLSMDITTDLPHHFKDTLASILAQPDDGGVIMFVGMSFSVKSLNLSGDILFLQNTETTQKFYQRVAKTLDEYDLD